MYSDKPYLTQGEAISKVTQAVKKGLLIRPDGCELCGKIPPVENKKKSPIQAHHWNSYRNPLDVWFVCGSCNQKLADPVFHCGLFTKEQGEELVVMSSEMRRALKESYTIKYRELIDWMHWNITPKSEP